jgi:hypothetical protein
LADNNTPKTDSEDFWEENLWSFTNWRKRRHGFNQWCRACIVEKGLCQRRMLQENFEEENHLRSPSKLEFLW